MKITRTPLKKSAPLPAHLAEIVQHLVNDDQDQIEIWARLQEWTFPRGDLFQFVAVLNRFDTILETVCQKHQLDKDIQRESFTSQTKSMLLAILNFSKILFENCTNRNLYNSYEHLNHLLNTTDIDILEAVVHLMLKPAQRVNNPKAVPLTFVAPQDKITELARGGSIVDLTSTELQPKEFNKIQMSFYRTGEGKDEGSQVISKTLTVADKISDRQLFWKLVEDHQIPKEYHFELLNRIRIANYITNTPIRRQLLVIKFISIVIMAHTMSETIAQNRVFIYEPHLVPQIAQLVCYDTHVPIEIQTYALYALDGIARHRTKVTEVLAAFNASANHGVLLHILRQLNQPSNAFTIDFLDALFTLLSFLVETPAGGQMLMSAGIMSTLIHVMDHSNNTNKLQTKALIKIVGLLDTIMSHINTSFSSFCNVNGLDSLLKTIEHQVKECINQFNQQQSISHDSLTLVKNALRFLIRMMESNNTADGLRNLIESSIPHTLKTVIENHKVFGPSVYSLSIHVATTFIHNEPTSLSVLQEIKLPQTFLKTFIKYDEANCEVLMSALHAFGAICLNPAGLEMFTQANPLPHFFKLMTQPSFVANPAEVGGATSLGTTMDELIRHHPALKLDVFKCANQLLQQVIEMGNLEMGKPVNNCHELATHRQQEDPSNKPEECLLLDFVDLIARFLEGFFRNMDNVKEFIRYGGPELLLRYYLLPMLPYDFSISRAFDSLGHVFRTIADVSPILFANLIKQKVDESSQFIFTDLSHTDSLVYAYTKVDGNDKELLKKGNVLFKKFSILFGYIGILSTVFASAILTNSKSANKLVEWCLEKHQDSNSVISLLGSIHRTIAWQNILLRKCVPKSWYNTANLQHQQLSAEETVDLRDPQVINFRRFKLILSEAPPSLMPVLQGIIKVSVSRRSSQGPDRIAEKANAVAIEIANVFYSNFVYIKEDYPACKYDYYASMFSMVSMLLLDDRSKTALQTPIAVAFDAQGNIAILLNDLLPSFWKSAEDEIIKDDRDELLLQRINTCIELLLAILHHFGSSKLLHNSPHTTLLTNYSKNETAMDPFYWMACMQLKLSDLYKYLDSPVLHKFSRHALHSLLRCVCQTLKAEGESRPGLDISVHRGNSDFEINRNALIRMGFEPELVGESLRTFDNALGALDNLFSRRLVEHRVLSGPPTLEISPALVTSNPLTPQEFEAGARILVNMWYDPELAQECLRENNNLAQASLSLSMRSPTAIRIPSSENSTPAPSTVTVTSNRQVEQSVDAMNEEDDDMYEDVHEDHETVEVLEKLGNIRQSMRLKIPQILANLVDERSDVDFEIRDLMVVLCCGDAVHTAENTKQTIRLFFESTTATKDKRALFESSINKIRIFALMLREPAMQEVMSLLITTMSGYIDWFDFLNLIVTHPNFPDPKWLTTLFLILEAGLTQADEPEDGSEAKEGSSTPYIVTPENRLTLMNYCISLLKMESLSEDNLISTLRIIVRLTKHHSAALKFVELGGLQPLFKRPSTSFETIKIQQTYIIMILRHIIDSKLVLAGCMEEWFSFCFASNKRMDATSFIKNNNNIVLRDPETFLEVATKIIHLQKSSSFGSNYSCEKKKHSDFTQSAVSVDEDKCSSTVINFLLDQLNQTQAIETETNIKFGYTGFLLQCLLELVSSYPTCKYDIVKYSSHGNANSSDLPNHLRTRQSVLYQLVNKLLPYNAINPSADQERKKQGVSMWVASLVVAMCYDTSRRNNTNVDDLNKTGNKTAVAPSQDLVEVRKHILDIVSRSFKDTLQSTSMSTSAKYIKYFALAELCHRILNARPTFVNPASQHNQMEETVLTVSKLMLEKNFMPILISVISDVDVNYPHSKMILNSILRPLEQLTKLAIRIDRSSIDVDKSLMRKPPIENEEEEDEEDEEEGEEEEEEEEDNDIYLPMDIDDDNEAAEEEVNELYRNSSLAMFDSTAIEDTSTDESSDDDMEMASSGEESISGDGEFDSSEETGSDEEEGVSEAEEMDNLMRSHRYHHPDTEEDDEDESTEGSDSNSSSESGDSYSSSSYESSIESLNSDRSDSIHSDTSRVDWNLDDINDGGHRHNENTLFGRRHRHNHGRQTTRAEIMFDTDNEAMDPDQSDSAEEQDSEDLDQDELDNVERNLELFARGGGAVSDINPVGRNNPIINSASSNAGAGRFLDRDNIILHPLLRSTLSPSTSRLSENDHSPENAILSGTNSNHLQAYEDIIGGSAVHILQNLLIQQQQRAESQQQQHQASDPSTANEADESVDSKADKEALNILQDFQPMQSTDRWSQEIQMVYIHSVAAAKAAKITDTLIAKLLKTAKNEEPTPQPATEPSNGEAEDITMDIEDSDEEVMSKDDMTTDDEEYVTENESGDEEVIEDIEDIGSEEGSIVEEQERVTITIDGEEVDITGRGIDVEFLEALPDYLRAEVLSQQMDDRGPSIMSTGEEDISLEFLNALPPDIRDEIVHRESAERNGRREAANSSVLPIAINAAEPNDEQTRLRGRSTTTEQNVLPVTNGQSEAIDNSSNEATGNSNISKDPNASRKAVLHHDAIRIVDRPQLATLTRLLFVPQSISKALLNKLLLNLCENSKTRKDLLSLLVGLLQDGSSDLAAVDKSFTQLYIQMNKKEPHNPSASVMSSENNTVDEEVVTRTENVPNLITQRCLEMLYYVTEWNVRSLAYFLTENKNFDHLKRRNSIGRKFKNKDKSNSSLKHPMLVLIGLLDRPTFLNNNTMMEQLMNLLATMCGPLPSIVRKFNESINKMEKDTESTSNDKQHRIAKPPVFPKHYLQKIAGVFSIGECSSHTFNYTLKLLLHLSALEGALDIIIDQLTETAYTCGRQIAVDLEQLYSILEKLKTGIALEGSALAQFSATTSHQTRLLRVLKAMDYLIMRKRVVSPGQQDIPTEDKEKSILQIYTKLDFLPLWKMLGSCLTVIQDRDDLMNVATVLLPLVESFMSVSKYSANKGYNGTGFSIAAKVNPEAEDFFFTFTEEHKKILNIMVRNNPSLMSGSFSLLNHNPKILEFDNKRNYFLQQLLKKPERREHHPSLNLHVRRAQVFQDTYEQLQGRSGKEIKYGKLKVQFRDEEGVDAGGVSREWFSVLARQMFDPNYALFITSAADKLTYQPNRASGVTSNHLSYFKFVGRIIGKAIHDGRLLDAYFTRSFYKLMLGRSVDYRDVEAVDPTYYKSLVWMLENDITDIIDLTFSVETDDFGTNKIIDLKPNGRNIPVTEENKHDYVTLITEHKLVLAIKEQVNAFLEGFHDIIPTQLIQIFNEQELELLISGLPDIDIDEWKANTVYEGYTLSSPQIQWFWRAVRSFDQEERAKLLQFSTGTSKVPLEGFSALQGSNGVQKFQIHKEFGDVNRLPSAHTCFNQIDLPQYLCYEDLRANLFKAISECSTGFAFN